MRISPDAEQRVLTAARELGYRPSLLARGLRSQLTQTIGLISDVVATEPYAGQLIRGAMSAALAHEQLIFVAETGGDPALEGHLVQSMCDRGVVGSSMPRCTPGSSGRRSPCAVFRWCC